MFQVQTRIGSVLSRLLGRERADSREEREAELHLYVVSRASRLYLQLQSSWNSFIIVSDVKSACGVSQPCEKIKSSNVLVSLSVLSGFLSVTLSPVVSAEDIYLQKKPQRLKYFLFFFFNFTHSFLSKPGSYITHNATWLNPLNCTCSGVSAEMRNSYTNM